MEDAIYDFGSEISESDIPRVIFELRMEIGNESPFLEP
jgi:hypothetical protein